MSKDDDDRNEESVEFIDTVDEEALELIFKIYDKTIKNLDDE